MRHVLPALFAPVLCLATAYPAVAVIPLTRPPLAQRVVLADCIITGKVAKLEGDLVQAFPPLKIAGAPKIPYRIAVVKVDHVLQGAKDVSELRVGFVPLPARDNRVLPRYRRLALVELTEGEEGCLFLQKHPEESFYVIQAPYQVLDKAREKTYEADVAEIKRCLRLLKDPLAGLNAPNADDRRLTAALLLVVSRRPRRRPGTGPRPGRQRACLPSGPGSNRLRPWRPPGGPTG